ncbi:NAD(P)H-dependent oxidoreductase [Candidatus Parcubacteria bacterium]|nr:MAG: NAD(P)H-dependent oxidoreductase [Candidatus Parcubacteria bacterium]
MGFLDNLDWRFATKEFDPEKPVSKEQLEKVLAAIRLAPTSYGLQPFHVYVIEDMKIKKGIKTNAFLQKQMDTASYLLVFCARVDKDDMKQRVDEYINLLAGEDKLKKVKLEPARLARKASIQSKSAEEFATWAMKQCYIALGFGLAACAELKIDSCPMEGFSKEAIDRVLELPESLKSTVILAIGNRKEGPKNPKVRFSNDELFTHI